MSITCFEEVDINNLDSYYSKEIEVDLKLIEIDLNFETRSLDPQQIENLDNSLQGISGLLATSWQWILNDYANGDEVNEYISFHLDDFFEDDPEEILAGTDPSLDNKDRFLKTLRVDRIGIYPASSDNYITIDWMTNPDLSNYILVVNVNKNLELGYLTIES